MTYSAILAVISGIIAPLFSVICLGAVAGKLRIIPIEGVRTLNTYVYLFATPALLFLGVSSIDFVTAFRLDWLIAYCVPTLCLHLLTVAIFRYGFGLSFLRSGVLGQGATFSNSVIFGIPLTYAAWGDVALPQALTIIGLHMAVHHSLIAFFAELENGKHRIISWNFISKLVVSYIRHPIVLSVAAGIGASLMGLQAGGSLKEMLELLARSQAPVGLFTLGLSVSSLRISGDFKQAGIIIFINGLCLPLSVWGLCTQVFDFEPLTTAVLVMIATCPIGKTANLYAVHYNTARRPIATGVIVSTILSIFTLSYVVVSLSP